GFVGEGERHGGVSVDDFGLPVVEIRVVLVDLALRGDQKDLGHIPVRNAHGVRRAVAVELVQLLRNLVDREADFAALLEILTRLWVEVRCLGFDDFYVAATGSGVSCAARKGESEGCAY